MSNKTRVWLISEGPIQEAQKKWIDTGYQTLTNGKARIIH